MERERIERRTLISLVAVGIFLSLAVPVAAEPSYPFAIRDLVMLGRIGAPAPSPDGSWIVFPLRSTNLTANKGITNLWITRPDGTGLHQLTFPPASDAEPCWSSDSSIVYYLSTRSGSSRVWKIAPTGGNAVQVTDLPLDLANLKISPDGKALVFSLQVFLKTGYEETAALRKMREEQNSTGRVYDALPVRHWDTYEDGRRNHIFVMPLATGIPVDMMDGMDTDCPSKPFGGSGEYTFTPDSEGIVFSAGDTGPEEMWTNGHRLWLARVSGMGRPVSLTPTVGGSPRPSSPPMAARSHSWPRRFPDMNPTGTTSSSDRGPGGGPRGCGKVGPVPFVSCMVLGPEEPVRNGDGYRNYRPVRHRSGYRSGKDPGRTGFGAW